MGLSGAVVCERDGRMEGVRDVLRARGMLKRARRDIAVDPVAYYLVDAMV